MNCKTVPIVLEQKTGFLSLKVTPNNDQNYNWSISGGGTFRVVDENEVLVTWDSLGTYKVMVEISNDCGESLIKEANVEVVDFVDISNGVTITGDSTLCLGSNYNYTIVDENNYEGLFKTYRIVLTDPDGEVVNKEFPNKNSYIYHSYFSKSGRYQLQLFVKQKCGISGLMDEQFVDVYESIDPNFDMDGSCIAITGQDEVYSVPVIQEAIYEWRIDGAVDGGSIISQNNGSATINWDSTGIYTVIVQISKPSCAKISKYIRVEVFGSEDQGVRDSVGIAPPKPVITGPDSKCFDENSYFRVTGPEKGVKYYWTITDPNNNILIGGDGPFNSQYEGIYLLMAENKKQTTAGIYKIEVVGDRCGLRGEIEQKYIEVLDTRRPDVPTIYGSDYVCDGEPATYSADSIPGLSYTWDISGDLTGDIVELNDHTIQVNWDKDSNPFGGGATINVIANNGFCERSSSKYVRRYVFYNSTIYGKRTVCRNEETELSVFGYEPNEQVHWDLADGISPNPDTAKITVSWNTSGIKPIRLIKSRYGCEYIQYDTVNVVVVPNEPPAAVDSSFYISHVEDFSVRLNYGIKTGTRRLVIVREGQQVTFTPVDGIEYNWNSNLGDGHEVAAIIGTNSSFIVHRDLSPSTTYYYKVFEYNQNSCETNYLTSNTIERSVTTLCTTYSPSIRSSNVRIVDKGYEDITLEWDNGDGQYRIITASREANHDTRFLLTDGATYNANPVYGSGDHLTYDLYNYEAYVVYKGNGNSVNISNIKGGWTEFKITEFNVINTCFRSPNYHQSNSTQFVYYNSCWIGEPTSVSHSPTASNLGLNNVDIAWTEGQWGTKHLLVIKENSPVTFTPDDGEFFDIKSGNMANAVNLGDGNYNIYNGYADNVSLTGLKSDKLYHYAIFDYKQLNGCDNGANFKIEGHITGSFRTECKAPEPSEKAKNLRFTGLRDNQVQLDWTNGNGSKRLIVARENYAVNKFPVDNNSYSAVWNFGRGSDLGNGNYVVYNGSGSSMRLYDLKPETRYYFAIFEYNFENDCLIRLNYLTSSFTTGSVTTKCTIANQPTNTGTFGEQLILDTDKSLFFNWTKGNGAKRVVIARKGSPVSKKPNDGYLYNANTSFGSGQNLGDGNYVVYNDTGNGFTLSNLTPSTSYHIAIFEYNQNNGCYKRTNYLTSSYITSSRSTKCSNPEPTAKTSYASTYNVSTTSMTLSWSGGNGARSLVIARKAYPVNSMPIDNIFYKAHNTFGNGQSMGSGNYVIYNGTDNSTSIYGLDPSTTYHFRIVEFNAPFKGLCYPSHNYMTSSYSTSRMTLSPPSGGGGGDDECLRCSPQLRTVKLSDSGNQYEIFSNRNIVNIIFKNEEFANSEILIYDLNGRLVEEIDNKTNTKLTIEFQLERATSGKIYFVRILNKFGMESKKIFLID